MSDVLELAAVLVGQLSKPVQSEIAEAAVLGCQSFCRLQGGHRPRDVRRPAEHVGQRHMKLHAVGRGLHGPAHMAQGLVMLAQTVKEAGRRVKVLAFAGLDFQRLEHGVQRLAKLARRGQGNRQQITDRRIARRQMGRPAQHGDRQPVLGEMTEQPGKHCARRSRIGPQAMRPFRCTGAGMGHRQLLGDLSFQQQACLGGRSHVVDFAHRRQRLVEPAGLKQEQRDLEALRRGAAAMPLLVARDPQRRLEITTHTANMDEQVIDVLKAGIEGKRFLAVILGRCRIV